MSAARASRTLDLPSSDRQHRGARGRRRRRRSSSCTAPAASRSGTASCRILAATLPRRTRRCCPASAQSTGLERSTTTSISSSTASTSSDALGLERPYVVGESMGGWIAAEMAALRPREIGRLALAAPIGLWRDEAPVVDLFGMTTNELVPFLFHDHVVRRRAADARRRRAALSDKDDRTEAQVEFLIGLARGFRTGGEVPLPDPESGARETPAAHHGPGAPPLGPAGDRLVPPAPTGRIFAESAIPGARLETIDEAGHLLLLERPDQVAAAATRFLAACDGGHPVRPLGHRGGPAWACLRGWLGADRAAVDARVADLERLLRTR